ncbi:glycosyl hydrolase family 17 protein [Alteromonas facilis]|uniref:glycoside hydrolase family 17 protein n=1 Tax=Alteromonas facilis TaxID=2048004 RepID=UPI001F0B8FDA|nr:glycosyl hydrolase family 17 protein [Alteromonas facilis]
MSKLTNPYLRKRHQSQESHSAENQRLTIKSIIEQGIHGLCFSPYIEGQGPRSVITKGQVKQRLELIAGNVSWVRSFSCTEGNELVPIVAKEMGLSTLVGVWLDDDFEANERELAGAFELLARGVVDMLAVGNEVMLREEMTAQQLVSYIERAKAAAKGVPVGYVDAYYLFEENPIVADACDIVFANCYPFWEGYDINHALVYMKDMYYRAKAVAGDKPVIISETGWPNQGSLEGQALPSEQNAMRYFIDATRWTEQLNIPLFYFSAFDEAWKIDVEGDVGAYWGLWDKDGKPKFW